MKSKSSAGAPLKASLVVRRSVVVAGHRTNVSLEKAFWEGIKVIAASRKVPLPDLISMIDSKRQHGNLSSAIRLFVLDHYRALAHRPPPIDPTS
jgi:predicted DNA-binding ribbon-helix-helix protein